MFWLDDALCSDLFLDGVVTVVDAKFCAQHLREVHADGAINECQQQVALADRIIVNKTDLVATDEVDALCALLRDINGSAQYCRTSQSR